MQLEGRTRQEGLLPCDLWFPQGNQPAFLGEAPGPSHGPHAVKGQFSLGALPTTFLIGSIPGKGREGSE